MGEPGRWKISANVVSPVREVNGSPKKVMRGVWMPTLPLVRVDPVDEHEPDDLAERQRHDGEIVAAQAQHRKAQQYAPKGGEQAGDGQADPECPRPEHRHRRRDHVGGDDRVGVGADGVEGDVAEIQQAGETDDDVEAPGEHHVDEDLHAEIVDPLDGAGLPRQRQRQPRKDQQRGEPGARQPRLVTAGKVERGKQHAACALGMLKQAPQQPAGEHGDDNGGDELGARIEHDLMREVLVGAEGDKREAQPERDERPDGGVLDELSH